MLWDELVPSTKSLIERGMSYTIISSSRDDKKQQNTQETTAALIPTIDTVTTLNINECREENLF